jgi:hypothetical protein
VSRTVPIATGRARGFACVEMERASDADDAICTLDGSSMGNVRVYMSFDLDHDQDLRDLLLEQSRSLASGFEISARSERRTATGLCEEKVRRRIRDADEVIVICGEHTGTSAGVSAELRIAQEEQKPYFLLWGRRESMCTKPSTARPKEGMYSWTWEILQNQIVTTLRNAEPLEIPEHYKRP